MSLRDLYPLPDIDPSWSVPQEFDAVFDWEFGEGRTTLMHLYQKGKDMQWDAVNRIDWSLELDPENPMELPPEAGGLYGSPIWNRMSEKDRIELTIHAQSWNTSQFLQGEQAALLCASKIVTQVPDLDSKFYAATQVMDEARHVEAYKKLLEKFGVAYPMTSPLQELVNQAMRDSRWDMTYLAMQVVIEGLALVAEPLAGVMVGEAFRPGAVLILPWIALAGLMKGVMTYYFHESFILGRRTRAMATIMGGAALFNLALNVAFIPMFGIAGAAAATVIAYAASLLACAWIGRRIFALPLPWFDWGKTALATAGMAAAVIALPAIANPFIDLVVSMGAGVTVFAALALALDAGGCRSWIGEARARLATAEVSP